MNTGLIWRTKESHCCWLGLCEYNVITVPELVSTHFHPLGLTWLFPALWEELRKETLEEEAEGGQWNRDRHVNAESWLVRSKDVLFPLQGAHWFPERSHEFQPAGK